MKQNSLVRQLMKEVEESVDAAEQKDKEQQALPQITENEPNLSERWGNNPFKIPKEDEWINLRQKEKLQEKSLRQLERKKKVHEKHTFRTRYSGTNLPAVKQLMKELDQEDKKDLKAQDKRAHLSEAIAKTAKMCRVRHVEREFTHDLIQRKKEMFLVNFSIQTKREEIEKFKKKEIKEDQKVQEIEQRLQEDALVFDNFLKTADEVAVDAMKSAERESKQKFDKIAEYRRVQVGLSAAKNEISKKDELLADYLSYKAFLRLVHYNQTKNHFLTSEQWNQKKLADRAEKVAAAANQRKNSKTKKRVSMLQRKSFGRRGSVHRGSRARSLSNSHSKSAISLAKLRYPEEWDEDQPDESETSDEISHILEDPKYLVKLIRTLEEENLRLILHFQLSETSLEEIKIIFEKTVERVKQEEIILKTQVFRMKELIIECETSCQSLQLMCKILDDGAKETGDHVLAELNVKVAKVYKAVFGRLIVNIDSITMLTCIESRMEELLDQIEALPPSTVAEIQKIKDKERRLMAREEKLAYQKMKQEERARRAQERAKATVMRKTGRKLVFRSAPQRAKQFNRTKIDGAVSVSDSYLFFEKD